MLPPVLHVGVGEADRLNVLDGAGVTVAVSVVLDKDKTVVKGEAGSPWEKSPGFCFGQAESLQEPVLQ